MRRSFGFLVRLLWPPRCVACGALTIEEEAFCAACALSVLPLAASCARCAGSLARDDASCRACAAQPFPFRGACAPLVYGGPVADALIRFKHGRRLAAARPLGHLLAPALCWAVGEGADRFLPVPLHARRLRARGFNQALELLREADLHRRRSSPSAPLRVFPDTLVRTRDTPPLGHEPPTVRRERVDGAFRVRRSEDIRGRRVLVVDDVMTTGATLAECARTLLDAGAESVLVAALARAL